MPAGGSSVGTFDVSLSTAIVGLMTSTWLVVSHAGEYMPPRVEYTETLSVARSGRESRAITPAKALLPQNTCGRPRPVGPGPAGITPSCQPAALTSAAYSSIARCAAAG